MLCEYCQIKTVVLKSEAVNGSQVVRIRYCPKCRRAYNTREHVYRINDKKVQEQDSNES